MLAQFRTFRPWSILLVLLMIGCGGETSSGSGSSFPAGTPPTGTALGLDANGNPVKAGGLWWGSISTTATSLQSEQSIPVTVKLTLGDGVLKALAAKDKASWGDTATGAKLDRLVLLLTAERVFDGNGWQHRGTDEGMSTLLTPTGLPIQGGAQGAVTSRFNNSPVNAPIDVLSEAPLPTSFAGQQHAEFKLFAAAMKELPPGLYRFRASFGVRATHYNKPYYYDLHYSNITRHQFHDGSYMFSSPLLPASGPDVTGKVIDAKAIQARIPWTILNGHNSNGYSGVVAEEDRKRFALGQFSLIHDEVVLPRFSTGTTYPASYNLEPVFPFETYYTRDNIDWDWTKGEMSVEVLNPNGTITTNVVAAPIVAKSANRTGPTTNNKALTEWKPSSYGLHTVTVKGWMVDKSGRRYEGGGTYKFWIARRLTMATATFQGMAYPVGYAYGRDISFSPAVPASVEITSTLYPDSDPAQAIVVTSSGTATAGGVFGVPQGMKQLSLSKPGEYHGKIVAQYKDADGELWVCVMRHAGVVYPTDSLIVARGKKLRINNAYVDRGDTNTEGYSNSTESYLHHIAFPYNPGDVLLMASENQGANKIEPVLIYENKDAAEPWSNKLDDIGTTNLFVQTSNGLSPHMFPEYVTARQYYYASAARPGFMARFLVADSVTRAPYWATAPNDFGGQAGSSYNGDQPGDLYRFIGGIVKQDAGKAPAYAGYLSSGAILPKGSNNNRVVAPGSTDIIGSKGEAARFFLTPSFRPGMTYMQGATWRPALQVDPMVPATVTLKLTYPDGSSTGPESSLVVDGSWTGAPQVLTQPGVYRVEVSALWDGHTATIPGLPATGGEFYVLGEPKPAGAQGLVVDREKETVFKLSDNLRIEGRSTATTVHYALIMPGAVIAQGTADVVDGRFVVEINPTAVHASTPIYDLMNYATNLLWGNQATADQYKASRKIMHLSLFSKEKASDGKEFWDFHRVITRGGTVLSVK